MCGIGGIIGLNSAPIDVTSLCKMTNIVKHRGPDGRGIVLFDPMIIKGKAGVEEYKDEKLGLAVGRNSNCNWSVGLAHTRLSIIDLSALGHQPMTNTDSSLWISYNGEIYNYLELREELILRGYEFRSNTDTEVVLASYREWGSDCVQRFNGMWAFALYDSSRNILFCSRDRFGIKPFYYIQSEQGFFFASEIRALLQLAKRKATILRRQLADALVYGITDGREQTLYEDVKQLPGAHSAIFDIYENHWRIKRYWDLPEESDLNLSDEQTLDRYEELLEDSVRLRLRADVPVALTLSGGIDSSAIAVALNRVHKEPIPVYASHFSEHPEIDETAYAQEVARHCGFSINLIEPDLSRMNLEEPQLCRHQELTFGSLSLYVHWAILSRICQHGTKVVLSGQGGDELFLGYERYFVPMILAQLPNIVNALKTIIECGRNTSLGIRGMLLYLGYFFSGRAQTWWRRRRFSATFSQQLLDAAGVQARKLPANRRALQRQEILGEQLLHLLRYDDRTSSAHGIETRLPFLDFRMVEFAYLLPWRFKIRQGWNKWISRIYLQRHGLEKIAWRKHKLAFNAPTEIWARQLWRKYSQALGKLPIRKDILRRGFDFDGLPEKGLWETYNILQTASQLNWKRIK